MVKTKETSIFKRICITAFIVTLALSPNINKDSLIIPKVSILFLLAVYLLPILILSLKNVLKVYQLKILAMILTFILLQLVLVFIISDAPFEQQLYGRTGRGLGFLTQVSILIITFASAISVRKTDLNRLIKLLSVSGIFTSSYAILQSYGIDFLRWDSRTNGVIGTLGNPNFQSSFAAIVFVPAIFAFWNSRLKYLISFVFFLLLSWTIYRTQSTQGYIGALLATSLFSFIFLWYKNRKVALSVFTVYIGVGILAILGMLNFGPLKNYLYKVSVQSRGDFWRSAVATANDNSLVGVGIDSFGDSYLKYRDLVAVNHPWAEYTDNAHNYFLEHAATGGYPLLIFHIALVLLTFLSFISVQRSLARFDIQICALFSAWVVFQAQSIISPGNISMMLWNSVISGAIIGFSSQVTDSNNHVLISNSVKKLSKPFSALLIIFGIIIYYPLFNTDRLQMQAMTSRNGDLAILSAKKFPESVLRYSVITRELLDSQLPQQALDVARSAVKFNPNSPNLWALILINPVATIEERQTAKEIILELDPLNKEVINFKLP